MQDSERDRLTVEVCEAVSAISPAGSHLATTAARLREMVGQEVPAGDYMKEVERLMRQYTTAVLEQNYEAIALYHFTLLAHIQRGAVLEGWKEATIAWEVCASIHREYAKKKDPFFTTRQADFVKHTEAARSALLAAAPDHFRDAAKMMAEPAEVPMPEPDYRGPAEAGDYFSGYTHTTMCAYGDAREAAGYAHAIKVIKRLRDSHQTATGECQSDCDFVTAWDSAIDALRGEVKP